MSTFVFTVAPHLSGNIGLLERNRFWDQTHEVRTPPVREGDTVYFWVTGPRATRGFVARAVVAGSQRVLSPSEQLQPRWMPEDNLPYRYRIPLRDVEVFPRVEMPWGEVEVLAQVGRLRDITLIPEAAATWLPGRLGLSSPAVTADLVRTDPVEVEWLPVEPEDEADDETPTRLGRERPAPDGGSLPTPSLRGYGQKVDHDARGRSNRTLGSWGEALVVDLLCAELTRKGRRDLVGQVVHVAETEGDGLGYDIRAVDEHGRTVYVEVKTTRGDADTPFYLSDAELRASEEHGDAYRLYRVYGWGGPSDPDYYVVHGPLSETCAVRPTAYAAIPSSTPGYSAPGQTEGAVSSR